MRLLGDTCVSFYLSYVAWDDLWKTPQARSREEAAFHFYFWKVLNNILPWLNEKSIKGETSCSSGFSRRPEVLMQVVSIQSSHLKRIKCWFQVYRARKLQKLYLFQKAKVCRASFCDLSLQPGSFQTQDTEVLQTLAVQGITGCAACRCLQLRKWASIPVHLVTLSCVGAQQCAWGLCVSSIFREAQDVSLLCCSEQKVGRCCLVWVSWFISFA